MKAEVLILLSMVTFTACSQDSNSLEREEKKGNNLKSYTENPVFIIDHHVNQYIENFRTINNRETEVELLNQVILLKNKLDDFYNKIDAINNQKDLNDFISAYDNLIQGVPNFGRLIYQSRVVELSSHKLSVREKNEIRLIVKANTYFIVYSILKANNPLRDN